MIVTANDDRRTPDADTTQEPVHFLVELAPGHAGVDRALIERYCTW